LEYYQPLHRRKHTVMVMGTAGTMVVGRMAEMTVDIMAEAPMEATMGMAAETTNID
jgi:hypothetical protein